MLEQQLKSYDERLKTRHKAKAQRTDLMAYSVVALGATIAVPDAAVGAIVHVTAGVTLSATSSSSSSSNSTGRWDVDGDGGKDFRFKFLDNSLLATSFSGDNAMGSAGKVSALAPGFSVSASGAFNGFLRLSNTTGTANFSNATGYMGFRFPGDTGTVGAQYGWAKVKAIPGSPSTLQILEWAYENCGDGIAVGATAGAGSCDVVPADLPASFSALTLLGIGAVGLGAFRRRRDKALIKMDKKAA